MNAIKHSFTTSANPKALFDAVATQAGMRAWWCKNSDLSEELGGHHELRFNKAGQPIVMKFKVTDRSPNRVAWLCEANDNPAWVGSTLVWEFADKGGSTEVNFVHDGFCMGGPPYEGTVAGWPRFMESLEQVAVGEAGNPL